VFIKEKLEQAKTERACVFKTIAGLLVLKKEAIFGKMTFGVLGVF